MESFADAGCDGTCLRAANFLCVGESETAPPEDEDPVQCFLLKTCKVGTAEDATGIVGFYLQRWRIEDFFGS